jgi:hypothetical protein
MQTVFVTNIRPPQEEPLVPITINYDSPTTRKNNGSRRPWSPEFQYEPAKAVTSNADSEGRESPLAPPPAMKF